MIKTQLKFEVKIPNGLKLSHSQGIAKESLKANLTLKVTNF